MPRATIAAWEDFPPWAVRTPRAAWKPPTSSAEVNRRTRITSSPAAARVSASSALKTIAPLAAPGEAGTPRVSSSGLPAGSKEGAAARPSEPGSIFARRLLPVEQALGDRVRGKADRGEGVPLGVSRLEDEEAPLLDRVLDVLDVAVVALQPQGFEQLGVDLGHPPGQAVEVLGVADPCHHVLPLRVEQEVAVRLGGSGGRVPRECHPGA